MQLTFEIKCLTIIVKWFVTFNSNGKENNNSLRDFNDSSLFPETKFNRNVSRLPSSCCNADMLQEVGKRFALIASL